MHVRAASGKSDKKQLRKSNFNFQPSVNFINVLRAAFTQADPESAKKTVKSSSFLRFWDLRA